MSIITPILNEEKLLLSQSSYYRGITQRAELIFIDGGSLDKSAEIAGRFGQILHSQKGRATQMNCGARLAQEKLLLFLHADTKIALKTLDSIETKVEQGSYIGGCLTQRIDKDGFAYRFIESFGNARARSTKVFYGDQGIFIRKDAFWQMGGFPEAPVMEDIIFSKKMRKLGKTIVLPDKIWVSPRRWEKQGILKTVFLYSLLNILFRLKIPLNRIKKLYAELR
ncbi:MAG: TIGR04283 family arsenosugar biosynthesis glycosyltransferase [Omnitrophica bacterium]|nr:TIGR04283 family arsenosugar biosynthesis glycosyltransferase [Candidatus Omnitrophota bacterium]